jgi:hypothetical protein
LPYRVAMAAPVAVPDAPLVLPEVAAPVPVAEPEPLLDEVLDADAGVVKLENVALGTVAACGWNVRMAAVAATVAVTMSGDRRTRPLP